MFIIALIISILILIAFFEYLYMLNPAKVLLRYGTGNHYILNYPLIFYIFAAFLVGIFLVSLIILIRDSARYIKNLINNRQEYISSEIDNSINKAEELYIRAQYEKAIGTIKKYLARYEDSIKAYLLLAKIYKHKGNIEESESCLNNVLKIDKSNVIALNEAGNLHKIGGDFEKAVYFFSKALEAAPDNLYAILELKDIYIKKGEWKNSYKMSKLFLSQSKDKEINKKEERDMIGLKYEYGKFLLENENDTERSAKRFNQVISHDKNFAAAYISLGDAYIKKGKADDAFKLWEKAFLRTGNFAVLIKMEDVAVKTNHPENIIKFYQELIYNNPEKWEYRLFLAKLYLRIEMVDEAISNLNAIPLSSLKDNSGYLLLAESYLKRGKYNEAAQAFRKALKNLYPVKLPFICSNCNFSSLNYSSLCPSCYSWNTMNIAVQSLYDTQLKEDSGNVLKLI